MSHDGKMRRGELSNDPDNIDRIYFLEQSKLVEVIPKTIEQMNKVELQEECTKQEKEFTDEMTKEQLIELINEQPEEPEDGSN